MVNLHGVASVEAHGEADDLVALSREVVFQLQDPRAMLFRDGWPRARANAERPTQRAEPTQRAQPAQPTQRAEPTQRAASAGTGPSVRSPERLPVLDWIPSITAREHEFAAELIGTICRLAESLYWRRTYASAEVGTNFMQRYGYAEIVGLEGAASERLACGYLLLGPETLYPSHRHEAREMYVILSGTAQWQQGDRVWRRREPGSAVFHDHDEPHAMRTGGDALLAMYLWHSTDLKQQAILDTSA